jgi:hypothetical protein
MLEACYACRDEDDRRKRDLVPGGFATGTLSYWAEVDLQGQKG